MYAGIDEKDAVKLSEHIHKTVLKEDKSFTVKIFSKKEAFLDRAAELSRHFKEGPQGDRIPSGEPLFFDSFRAVVL